MDSMKSLNTSLPNPNSGRPVPPEQLLQAFKSAALSVTNLYKSAVHDQNNNRNAGYQDALDDLLQFLDSENLGLQDGEGWRVRQWVTERYDGTANQPQPESDDERNEPDQGHATEVNQNQTQSTHAAPREIVTQRNLESRQQNDINVTAANKVPPPSTFDFACPSSSSQTLAEVAEPRNASLSSSPPTGAEPTPSSTTRIESPRHNRTQQRSGSLRHGARPSGRMSGQSINSKRKYPFPDINFFDFDTFGPREGPEPSNKRGRFA